MIYNLRDINGNDFDFSSKEEREEFKNKNKSTIFEENDFIEVSDLPW